MQKPQTHTHTQTKTLQWTNEKIFVIHFQDK